MRWTGDGIPDLVVQCVITYIQDARDRGSASLVCRRWYQIDAVNRKHVTVALCYSTTPQMLHRRFPNLESLKLKAKPRAAMFNLIPEDWGGYVTPWVDQLVRSFSCLKSLHFRRMIVKDSDLELLAQLRGVALESLKLDKCCGFSTDGLLHIGRMCKNLKTLYLEESSIVDKDGEWLHELALNNTVLEVLNFYLTDLVMVSSQDLELIARNCHSLTSVKASELELLDLVGFFKSALALEEFCGGSFNGEPEKYTPLSFPSKLCNLGLTYMGQKEMLIVFPFASKLIKLDLLYADLDTDDHCLLLQRCPNLEVLETRNVIGDRGLEVLAACCRKLRRFRIERGADDHGLDNEGGAVTHAGLMALAHGCLELEYMAIYVSDITNACLQCLGTYLKNLSDFRMVLLEREETVSDLPLDNGVQALLQGCSKLKRFALYLRQGGLTDVGLSYIGRYSRNIRWMLLGLVGESDQGLLDLAEGCPNLERLEMRGCVFSGWAIGKAVLRLTSLKYLWVQGYRGSPTGQDLLVMARPFWNIELIPARPVIVPNLPEEPVVIEHPAHVLAYRSLVGQRSDFPETVMPLVAGEENIGA